MEKNKKTKAELPKKKVAKPTKTRSSVKTPTNPSNQKYFTGLRSNLKKNKRIYLRYGLIALVVVLIGLFAFLNKNWFVVAVVNGQPVTTIDYYKSLKAKDGKEVLDQIIRNKVITQEANKKGVVITNSEIDKKIGEIEKQVGGKDQLKEALEARNITEADFKDQIKLQLTVEKLLSKEISVSDKEIDDYIAKNPTDPNVVALGQNDKTKREEIKEQLRSQKLNDSFQNWYDKLEKSAVIVRF